MTDVEVICVGGAKLDLIAMIFEFGFTDETPAGTRVAYFDRKRAGPASSSFIEINAALEQRCSNMYAESLIWDGKDAVRRV